MPNMSNQEEQNANNDLLYNPFKDKLFLKCELKTLVFVCIHSIFTVSNKFSL